MPGFFVAVGLMLVLLGSVLKTRCRLRQDERHREIRVSDGRPVGRGVEFFDVRAGLVFVYLRSRPVVYAVADGGYAFGRDGVEGVVRHALVADVRADYDLRVRYRLPALSDFGFEFDRVAV